ENESGVTLSTPMILGVVRSSVRWPRRRCMAADSNAGLPPSRRSPPRGRPPGLLHRSYTVQKPGSGAVAGGDPETGDRTRGVGLLRVARDARSCSALRARRDQCSLAGPPIGALALRRRRPPGFLSSSGSIQSSGGVGSRPSMISRTIDSLIVSYLT